MAVVVAPLCFFCSWMDNQSRKERTNCLQVPAACLPHLKNSCPCFLICDPRSVRKLCSDHGAHRYNLAHAFTET